VEGLCGGLTSLFKTYISIYPALHSISQGQKYCNVLPPWKDQVCQGVLVTAYLPTTRPCISGLRTVKSQYSYFKAATESKVKQMQQRLHSQIQNISFNQLVKALNHLQVDGLAKQF